MSKQENIDNSLLGTDVNIPNNDGLTLLHIASAKGYDTIVQKLIAGGAIINKLDINGDNAVNIAIKNRHIELAKFLIESGGVIETNYTTNLLFTACIHGNIELITALVKAGTDINLVSKNNYNVLHLALIFKQKDMLTQLLELGADINLLNDEKNTILHIALKNGDLDLVKKFYKFNPNWNLKNNENKSAFMLAIEKEYISVLKDLMRNKYEFEIIK